MFFFMAILMFDFTFAGKLITFKFLIPIPFYSKISQLLLLFFGAITLTKTSWFRNIAVRNTGYFFRGPGVGILWYSDNIGTSQLKLHAISDFFTYNLTFHFFNSTALL